MPFLLSLGYFGRQVSPLLQRGGYLNAAAKTLNWFRAKEFGPKLTSARVGAIASRVGVAYLAGNIAINGISGVVGASMGNIVGNPFLPHPISSFRRGWD